MNYFKFTPCEALRPFVECYYVWQSEEGELLSQFMVESPPNGFCSIVFNLGDLYSIQSQKYPSLQVPLHFVCGQTIHSYKLILNGRLSMAGIVFKPTGLASLLHLPVYEYTEERVDLKQLFDPEEIEATADVLRQQQSANERARLLEDFLLKHAVDPLPQPDAIDEAACQIVASNGLLHINDLIRNACMSRRNFERRFFKKVGLSPKYYARIRRMSYIGNLIAGKSKVDWASIFYTCEYYDQSHFSKDFIEFTGRTPQQYLQENRELAHFVKKPREEPLH